MRSILVIFQPNYWCGRSSKVQDKDIVMDPVPEGEFFEAPPTNVTPGIRIRNLKKVTICKIFDHC